VILERVMTLPSRDSDGPWSGYQRAARLHEQGVKLVISLSSGSFGDSVARNLPFHAGMARAHGLPHDVALASITLSAAEVIGVGDRLGSLEVGKQATMIAVRGDVLEITDPVERMWIAGEEVSLENRHTRLFERYRNRPSPGGE
jgi:imidazolonepropionase-like amidohydrolase